MEIYGSRLKPIWKFVEVDIEARGSQRLSVEVHEGNMWTLVEADGCR